MTTRKKTYLCFISALLMLGCKSIMPGANTQTACIEDGSCPIKDIKPSTDDSSYVSYADVAADYKAYGERTPLDHRVGTSGAASNLSSSIPPVIEDELALYEDDINGFTGARAQDDFQEEDVESTSLEDPVEDWLAEEGMTLKDLLSQWAEKSGWRLVWKTNRNYTLTAGAMFRARFADAASALVRAFARARPAPIATFYKGNRVLVIETMEDENAYE